MYYQEFLKNVQYRARLESEDDAKLVIEATLKTLAQRLQHQEAEELIDQLPQEVGKYLQTVKKNELFGLQEFYRRVARYTGEGLPEAQRHARAVI
jgi:uncharacterized protein (DUF2267 family)